MPERCLPILVLYVRVVFVVPGSYATAAYRAGNKSTYTPKIPGHLFGRILSQQNQMTIANDKHKFTHQCRNEY